MGYPSTTRSAAVKRLRQNPEYLAKLATSLAVARERFASDPEKVAAKAAQCRVTTTRAWARLTKKQRQTRARGLLATTAKRAAIKAARLGPAKECACGCGTTLKPGRTWVSGHNAAITPRHFTEEAKTKQREHIKTSAWKNFHGGKWAEAMARPQTEEHKRKNSEGLKRAIVEGRFDPGANSRKAWANAPLNSKFVSGKYKHLTKCGKYHSKKNGSDMYYESSWELARMEALEASANVASYMRIPCRLTYMFEGKQHFYFPDFGVLYADGVFAIEEIKPKHWLTTHKQTKAKIRKLKAHCLQAGYACHVLSTLEECQEVA